MLLDTLISSLVQRPPAEPPVGAGTVTRIHTALERGQPGNPPPMLSSQRLLNVLLVEDNQVNQRVARLMIEKLGHQVHTVNNGAEAVTAAAATTYDLILMDLQMPVMDGLEATRRILAQQPADQQAHIVAATASALVEDRDACTAAGMQDYLSKPVRAADLKRVLGLVAAAS
jgi:CheY-like chemotaxis protein